ncbi:gluconeogenesis factor YvcK family protein [Chitinilyticum piscinae]|uniref:Putative gluconeogenesis factor n=1 Tax=Chitinilyticum piscinae TaxID=2866724 RepID=A0A8J7FQI2_9NEIS|nr:uridine diphosphate-N-acetylglucosamine-binding protein YvcK [Chitinilyticum piscinae]MBE9608856.1 uridine diphosphate-N-acetylglucosamine-binding protein YvcK [Chitinilyticum piscinae]
MSKQYPKVVAIGGGTGLSSLLRGLKHFPLELTAIVTVADDGGSSGRLQRDWNVPPPGDIRNVLMALSEAEGIYRDLLEFRFRSESGTHALDGHSMGNLLLTALYSLTHGDFPKAVEHMGTVLRIKGRVLPVCPHATVLHAELEDGRLVSKESEIASFGSKVCRVFYDSPVSAEPQAIEAIFAADVIVLGPGSLYTSVMPNLLVKEVAAAINANTLADKVYVCNIMTEHGETDGMSASQHLQAILDHGIKRIDKIIVNDESIPQNFLDRYLAEAALPVVNDYEQLDALGVETIRSRIVELGKEGVRHDAIKTAASVYSIALRHQQ